MVESTKEQVRAPVQERSQKRVAQILEVARAIIEEKGTAGLKMNELAERANISIGSIYQYFSNKSSVVAMLAERALEANTERSAEILSEKPKSLIQLSHITTELLEQYYLLLRQDPVLNDILTGQASDKEFTAADQDDTVTNRDYIFEMSKHLFREDAHERAKRLLLITIAIGGAVAVLASKYDVDEGRKIMDDAIEMLYATWEVSVMPLGAKVADADS